MLLTNHMTFGSTTIAAIYKDRWQIEIFFKTIKQNLRIKTFVGTSPNALLIQIWTALIAVLILRDLWTWMDRPFEPPPVLLMLMDQIVL